MNIEETKNGIDLVMDAGYYNVSKELDSLEETADFLNEIILIAEKKFNCSIILNIKPYKPR